MFQIDNLSDLVKDYLGDDREFLDYKTTNLTAPGDNYGSLILSVEVQVKNKCSNEEEVVKVVAKTPPTSEFAQKIFNTKVTFKNEIEFYRTIWPDLQNFQQSHGMKSGQYVAQFAGARLNTNGSQDVDNDAVLLLENLAVSGFTVLDRMVGFDLATAKLILKDLANFHATVVAYKLQKPEDFKTKIVPYLDGMMFNNMTDPMMVKSINSNVDFLLEQEETKHLGLKARKLVDSYKDRSFDSIFTTVAHADLWVNNIMLKLDKNKNAIETKLVDFQVLRLQSPADDLIFFLMTSVQNDVIKSHLEELIEYYHKQFVSTLEQLKCNTKEFSYENFKNEIQNASSEQFCHIICMLFPILVEKDKVKDMKDFKPDEEPPTFELSEKQKEKLLLVAQSFEKMGWFD